MISPTTMPRRLQITARNKWGFTLLELLIVMVLLATMLAVAVPYAARSGKGAKIKQEGLNMVSGLEFAMDLARTTALPTRMVLDPKANSICLEISTPGNNQDFKPVDGFWGLPRYLDASIQIQDATNFASDGEKKWLCFDPGKPWPTASVSLTTLEDNYTIDIQGKKVEVHECTVRKN